MPPRGLIVCSVVLALGAATAHAARPAPCADGRFVVHDAPLLDALAVAVDVVVLRAPEVSIDSGCQAVRAKVKTRRNGTRIAATWPRGCGKRGRVRLRARLSDDCTTMTGTV